MWPDRVSNQGPLTYDSGALSTALRGAAADCEITAVSAAKLTVSGGCTDSEGDTGPRSGFVCVTVLGITPSSLNEVTTPWVTAGIIEVTIDLIRSGITPSLLLPA